MHGSCHISDCSLNPDYYEDSRSEMGGYAVIMLQIAIVLLLQIGQIASLFRKLVVHAV